MKKFNEFLNENAQMGDDNLYVTFELILKDKKYYILAQATNTQMQATFTEDGQLVANLPPDITNDPTIKVKPLKETPQVIIDSLKRLGTLDTIELGDATGVVPGFEEEEDFTKKEKSWVEMGQSELNYQLNIAIENEDWKKAEEIASFIKDKD